MNNAPKIWIAIPSLNEFEYIENTIKCIQEQTYTKHTTVVCVNQPDIYHYDKTHTHIVANNANTINLLKNKQTEIKIEIIDKSSKGNGWTEKHQGVGWARKLLFDSIVQKADTKDIIISMDADTVFSTTYFQSVVDIFHKNPLGIALSTPYYHQLSKNEELDRQILRYEIYMRYYALNLWRIESPYCFTALGSAIAFPISSYLKMRGISAKISGEDFYLLQKLRKNGRILHWIQDSVHPATRYSDRVIFGTGPALIKGQAGDWSTYPFYHYESFNDLQIVFQKLDELFYHNIPTPIDEYIIETFNTTAHDFWQNLRKNNKDLIHFKHAFNSKFDGLKTLQYLRYKDNKSPNINEEKTIINYLKQHHLTSCYKFFIKNDFSFKQSSVSTNNTLRNIFVEIENNYRIEDDKINQKMQSKKHISRWKYLGS